MSGIVGLTGYARSGKDTVADVLVAEHGYVKLPFAGPLKEMAKRINPIIGYEHTRTELHSGQSIASGDPVRVSHEVKSVYLVDALELLGEDETKSRYPEYRRFLQRLGTDGIRHVDEHFWIKLWVDAAWEILEEGYSVVAPDVRFPNEAEVIRHPAGVVARVSRSGLKSSDSHDSEKHVGNMGEDFVISNDGSLLDLQAMTNKYAKALPWA